MPATFDDFGSGFDDGVFLFDDGYVSPPTAPPGTPPVERLVQGDTTLVAEDTGGPTAWSPAFQVDTDTVGAANRANIAGIDTGGPSGGATTTITTASPHQFTVGSQVTIIGLTGDYERINGSYAILAVGSPTTFSFAFTTNLASRISPEGYALSPSPSYIRYAPHDTFLDAITAHATLHAEPWDYNTVRVTWGVDNPLDARGTKDINEGLIPLVVITRSGFGYPSTPLDGVQVLNGDYGSFVANAARTATTEYVETMPANQNNDWIRPAPQVQSLYDRNLTPGHWYYYAVFFYLGAYDNFTGEFIEQEWVRGATMDALLPTNEHHAERLYDLMPQYYQRKDQEFLAGTGRRGVVERFLQTIGFEVDYTKTLTEGLEHIYDIDYVHDDLLHSLGVFNFGVPVEDGLGDIRYRSLLAQVSQLYEIRGSSSGLQSMTNAATKYRCKALEGPNIMNLTDDAEFASGTGSWGNPLPLYEEELHAMSWLGRSLGGFNTASMEAVALLTTPEEGVATSLVPRRNAMLIGSSAISSDFDDPAVRFDAVVPFDGTAPRSVASSDVSFDTSVGFDYPITFDGSVAIGGGSEASSGAILLTCGLGQGFVEGRRHEQLTTNFYPRLHGIRCLPQQNYTFSGYSVLASDPPVLAGAAVGIMWFNDVTNGFFDFGTDFITKMESSPVFELPSVDVSNPGPFRRFFVNATAPLSLHGENYVFAVPYWVFPDFQQRYVSACMFHLQTNTPETVVLTAPKILRLGVPSEMLGSDYVLGSAT